MVRRWIYGIGVLAFGLVAVVALESTAFANKIARTAVIGEKSTVLHELRTAHKLLVEADHDYDGHRVKAAEEVHRAIRELEGKHSEKSTVAVSATTTPAVKKHAKVHEPKAKEAQAMSDGQLSKALGILKTVQSQIPSSHPKAGTQVSDAIANLNMALSIK
jgi:hypothetical protein